MRFTATSYAAILALASSLASAQTSTKCNPLEQSCPADPALGRTVFIDFTQGSSNEFVADGSYFTYNSNGAQLAVKEHGNSPTLISNWYIMFGRVDVVMQSAPGVGMVSSIVLQSDDLDEIDWEMLGYQTEQGQTNYFGKGITGSYNRGETVSDPGSTTQFNTYSVDWNAERINWEINGQIVRTLTYADAETGQYPQTPMQLKIGSWAPGDPSNPEGTVSWAGGSIDYSAGPFVFQVKSVKVQDYSTGSEYKYQGNSGNYQDIEAVGGTVGATGTAGNTPPVQSGSQDTKPSSLSMVTSIPATFTTIPAGTHKTQSSYNTPSSYPWVVSSSPQSQQTAAVSNSAAQSSAAASNTGFVQSVTGSLASATSVPSSTASTVASNSGSVATPNFKLISSILGAVVACVCIGAGSL